MASTTTSSSRGPILAALTGVVLLGVMVAFTLGLTAIADDDSVASAADTSSTAEPVELPDALPGDLVSGISDALPADLAGLLGDKGDLEKRLANGSEAMTKLYGAPSTLGIYLTTDQSAFVTVAVSATSGGLFMPDGVPPFDLEALGVTTPPQKVLEEVDGGVCNADFTDPSTGGALADRSVPTSFTCQYDDDERTYQISGQGLSEQQAIAALKGLSDYLAGDENAVPDASDLTTPATTPTEGVTPSAPIS